jgi:hypothetical protein
MELESQILTTDNMRDYCSVLRAHNPGDTLGVTVLRWDTYEVLTGQLNGRELEYSHTLEAAVVTDPGTSTQQSSSDIPGSDVPGTFTNPDAVESGEYYYQDAFDDMSNWEYELFGSEANGFTQESRNSKFRTEISRQNLEVYYYYKHYSFGDVQLDTRMENLGVNSNYTGLFCRYSDDGFYAAIVLNTGEFGFIAYDGVMGQAHVMYTGASRLINMGKAVNDYTLVCKGDELTLGINGTEAKTISTKSGSWPVLREGQVGLLVWSLDILPVIVEFDYFSASVVY